MILASCGVDPISGPEPVPGPVTVPVSSTIPSVSGPASPTPSKSGNVAGFSLQSITVAGERLLVAVADDADLRMRGLTGVDDLGDLDGMLFVFVEDTSIRFWMKDTLIPLDIAFFRADGTLVEVLSMVPCEGEPCPLYGPQESYRWALERPAGTMVDLGSSAVLVADS